MRLHKRLCHITAEDLQMLLTVDSYGTSKKGRHNHAKHRHCSLAQRALELFLQPHGKLRWRSILAVQLPLARNKTAADHRPQSRRLQSDGGRVSNRSGHRAFDCMLTGLVGGGVVDCPNTDAYFRHSLKGGVGLACTYRTAQPNRRTMQHRYSKPFHSKHPPRERICFKSAASKPDSDRSQDAVRRSKKYRVDAVSKGMDIETLLNQVRP